MSSFSAAVDAARHLDGSPAVVADPAIESDSVLSGPLPPQRRVSSTGFAYQLVKAVVAMVVACGVACAAATAAVRGLSIAPMQLLIAWLALVEPAFWIWDRQRARKLNAQPANHMPVDYSPLLHFKRVMAHARFYNEVCHHPINWRAYLSKWFKNAPCSRVRLGNLQEMLAYGFFYATPQQMQAEGRWGLVEAMTAELALMASTTTTPAATTEDAALAHDQQPAPNDQHATAAGQQHVAAAAKPSPWLMDAGAGPLRGEQQPATGQQRMPGGKQCTSEGADGPHSRQLLSACTDGQEDAGQQQPAAGGVLQHHAAPASIPAYRYCPAGDEDGEAAQGSDLSAHCKVEECKQVPAAGANAAAAAADSTPQHLIETDQCMLDQEHSAGGACPEEGPAQPVCVELQPGYTRGLEFMAHLWEPLRYNHRPLLMYLAIEFLNWLVRAAMYALGFRSMHLHGLNFYHTQGKGTPHSARPAAGSTPIVMLHGVGVGLFSYLPLVCRLAASGEPLLVPEFRHISMRLCTYVPQTDEVARWVVVAMKRLGWDKASVIAHSYGTFVASCFVQRHRQFVRSLTLIDPVCFGMFLPDLLHHFVYRTPKDMLRTAGWDECLRAVMLYVFSRDVAMAATFCRKFYWVDNNLWPEDLPPRTLVALAGKDDLLHAQEIRHILSGDYEGVSVEAFRAELLRSANGKGSGTTTPNRSGSPRLTSLTLPLLSLSSSASSISPTSPATSPATSPVSSPAASLRASPSPSTPPSPSPSVSSLTTACPPNTLPQAPPTTSSLGCSPPTSAFANQIIPAPLDLKPAGRSPSPTAPRSPPPSLHASPHPIPLSSPRSSSSPTCTLSPQLPRTPSPQPAATAAMQDDEEPACPAASTFAACADCSSSSRGRCTPSPMPSETASGRARAATQARDTRLLYYPTSCHAAFLIQMAVQAEVVEQMLSLAQDAVAAEERALGESASTDLLPPPPTPPQQVGAAGSLPAPEAVAAALKHLVDATAAAEGAPPPVAASQVPGLQG